MHPSSLLCIVYRNDSYSSSCGSVLVRNNEVHVSCTVVSSQSAVIPIGASSYILMNLFSLREKKKQQDYRVLVLKI